MSKFRAHLIITCLLVTSFIVISLCFIFVPSFQRVIIQFAEWLRSIGWAGSLIVVAIVTIGIVICVPVGFFELLMGFVYGGWMGFILSVIAKQIGCVISFLLGRYLIKDAVQEWLREHPKMRQIQRAILHREVRNVVAVRIIGIPIFLKNYGLSVINVRFSVFFWATLCCSIPFTALHVYLGTSAHLLVDVVDEEEQETNPFKTAVGIFQVLLLLGFMGLVYYESRRFMLESEQGLFASPNEHTPILSADVSTTSDTPPTSAFGVSRPPPHEGIGPGVVVK